MYLTTTNRLGSHDLAALLRLLVDLEYAQGTESLEMLFECLPVVRGVVVTNEQREQVTKVVAAVPLDALLGTGARRSNATAGARTMAAAGHDPVQLWELLYEAWVRTHLQAEDERVVVLEELAEVPKQDQRNKNLDGLGIADCFFLVAHDRYDGRPLLAASVLECGCAVGLLAELLCHNLITIDTASHQVQAVCEVGADPLRKLSAPALRALELIQSGRPTALGSWLTALSVSGCEAVRRHLVTDLGTVTQKQHGRLRTYSCFPPVDPDVVESILRAATRPFVSGIRPAAQYALLVELAKVTHLTVRRRGEWAFVHGVEPGSALSDVPARELFDLLLAITRAEVTDLLSRPG